MIYTSYWWKLQNKKIELNNFVPVQISRTAPVEGLFKIKWFMPSVELLDCYKRGLVNEVEYTKIFNRCLSDYENSNSELFEHLKNAKKDVVLFCYEANGKFCHRHLVAQYLNKRGVPCVEYGELI